MKTGKHTSLTQEELKKKLIYNPDKGSWIWISTGITITSHLDKRLQIKIEGNTYASSRLAFLYMTGSFPKHQVDHINRHPGDDRFCNLRDVTCSINNANKDSITRKTNNESKYPGVYKTPQGKYCAVIKRNDIRKCLGTFITAKQAFQAFKFQANYYSDNGEFYEK